MNININTWCNINTLCTAAKTESSIHHHQFSQFVQNAVRQLHFWNVYQHYSRH